MNTHRKLNSQLSSASCSIVRSGVTVIEVLTSMLVAAIGVFGVMVLIPFSVQQAQLGLDSDAGGVVAENAYEDLQIYGFTEVDDAGNLKLRGARVEKDLLTENILPPNFFSGGVGAGTATIADGPRAINVPLGCFISTLTNQGSAAGGQQVSAGSTSPLPMPAIIHFDPVAFSRVGFPTAPGVGSNPDFLTGNLPAFFTDIDGTDRSLNPLRVVVATAISNTAPFTLASVDGARELLSQAEIDRIFRTEDDLVSGKLYPRANGSVVSATEISDIELAQPVFDVTSQGQLVRRQANGRISWSAIMLPVKDDNQTSITSASTKYKVFVLVYSDRSVIPGDDDSTMIAAPVNRHESDVPPSINSHGGFDPSVTQVSLANGVTIAGVSKDDWIMLINRKPLPAGSGIGQTAAVPVWDVSTGAPVPEFLDAEDQEFGVQMSFAKVVTVDNAIGGAGNSILTVEGGPFNFYYSNVFGAGFGGGDTTYTSATYVIHLKNVINVFERTITLEDGSF